MADERERFDRRGRGALQLGDLRPCREFPRLSFELSFGVHREGGGWSHSKTADAIVPGGLLSLGNICERWPSGGTVDDVPCAQEGGLIEDEGITPVWIWRARRQGHLTSAAAGDCAKKPDSAEPGRGFHEGYSN